jgi:hypothetical protein
MGESENARGSHTAVCIFSTKALGCTYLKIRPTIEEWIGHSTARSGRHGPFECFTSLCEGGLSTLDHHISVAEVGLETISRATYGLHFRHTQ